jgi:O-antigen ligase
MGVALGIYGIFQILGKDFVAWDNPNNSMIATTGNPNFASSLLALLVLISITSIFLDTMPRIHKYFAILAIVIDVFAIIKSQSIQGLLVIFFGLSFATVLIFKYYFKKYVKIVLVTSSIFTILAVLGMLQIGPLANFLYKESVSIRGYYWRAAVKMFELSPWTGIGLDRYGSYFKEVREVAYPLKYGFDITSTNAHNTFLQMFATGGVFVGISYFSIILLVLFSGLKLIMNSNNNEQKISIALLSVWVGFQSQSLISIDNLAISIWGWTLS